MRNSADRDASRRPPVAPVDELGGGEQHDRQDELGEAVHGLSVGVPAKLAESREPGGGALDRPAQSHRLLLLRREVAARWAPSDGGIGDAPLGQALSGGGRVVAAVEPDGPDVIKQTVAGALRSGWGRGGSSRCGSRRHRYSRVGCRARRSAPTTFHPSLARSVGVLACSLPAR